MAPVPAVVTSYIASLPQPNEVGYLHIDATGVVLGCGGSLKRYGIDARDPSAIVDLLGVGLTGHNPEPLPFVQLTDGVYAEVHFVVDRDDTWIVLIDVTADGEARSGMQQRRLSERLARQRPETDHASSAAILSDDGLSLVFSGLGFAIFERNQCGGFGQVGTAPAWIEQASPDLVRAGRCWPETHLLLQSFMPDAERAWASQAGPVERSMIWSEEFTNGELVYLEAIAMRAHNREVLLLRKIPDETIKNSANVQRANQRALAADIAESKLHAESERLRVTLESIADGVLTTDSQGRVVFMNPRAAALTGWSVPDAHGEASDVVFRIIDDESGEPLDSPVQKALEKLDFVRPVASTTLISKTGERFGVRESVAPIFDTDGDVLGAVLVFQDVTESRMLARQVRHQAQHDPLTGLPNRREFEERLDRAIETARSAALHHAVLYLDLDEFKVVNDSCGHAAGDTILKQIARLMTQGMRNTDIVARVGGDEFCVLIQDCQQEVAERIAQGLLDRITRFAFRWNDERFVIGVSIGIVEVDATSGSRTEVIARADTACYAAKDSGTTSIVGYAADGSLRSLSPTTSSVPAVDREPRVAL